MTLMNNFYKAFNKDSRHVYKRHNSLPRVLFLSDEGRIKDPYKIIKAMPQNSGIILRDYNNPARQELINTITQMAEKHRLTLFIANNGEANNSYKGVKHHHHQHWPNSGRAGQRRGGRYQLITTSAHNLADVGRANRLNVDAIFISPVFNTKSHPEKKPLNIHKFARLAKMVKMPVYALGGINSKTARPIIKYGIAYGIAGISLFEKTNQKN